MDFRFWSEAELMVQWSRTAMKRLVIPLVALASSSAFLAKAEAANADRMVIPAVAPMAPQASRAIPSPVRAAETQRVAPRVYAANQGQYGGGFIEMLVTGRDPSHASRAVIYNRPPDLTPSYARPVVQPAVEPRMRRPAQMQASIPTHTAPVSREIDPMFRRQEVDYRGPHGAGTIVVDTPNRFLYLVTGSGRALRYGIGVGRPGFTWAGVKSVTRKAEWPDWRPPPEMLKRRPDLPTFMPGGPENPLGARALYLGSSLYRIHGTNEPYTIGQNVSSGCIRMMNDDVVDLYRRVKVGAKVVVR